MGVGECVCGIFHPRFQLFKDSSFTLLEREKREWWALGGRSRRRSFSHSDMLRTLMTCWTSRVCSTQIPRAGYIEIVFSSPLARRDPSPPSLMVSPRSAPTFYFYFSKNCCFFYYFRLFFSKKFGALLLTPFSFISELNLFRPSVECPLDWCFLRRSVVYST